KKADQKADQKEEPRTSVDEVTGKQPKNIAFLYELQARISNRLQEAKKTGNNFILMKTVEEINQELTSLKDLEFSDVFEVQSVHEDSSHPRKGIVRAREKYKLIRLDTLYSYKNVKLACSLYSRDTSNPLFMSLKRGDKVKVSVTIPSLPLLQ